MSLDENLNKKFEGTIFNNVELSKYSWFNLGGQRSIYLNLIVKTNF